MKNVAIVHYNTPEITEAAIKSVWKHTPDCNITVFDNSDRRPFGAMDGVSVIDNTKGQVVNFDEMLARYPNKIPTACNWGSEKHIASVEHLWNMFPEGFVLADSDILVKKDFSDFFDDTVAWVGGIEWEPRFWFQAIRLFPFLLWINTPMCNEKRIRFFHEGMVYKMSHNGAPFYDTAGSFYYDCNNADLPGREVNLDDYILHFGAASCGKDGWRQWLDVNRNLYE